MHSFESGLLIPLYKSSLGEAIHSIKMLIDNSITSNIVIAYLMKANKLEDTDKLHTSLLYQTEVYFKILVVYLILKG